MRRITKEVQVSEIIKNPLSKASFKAPGSYFTDAMLSDIMENPTKVDEWRNTLKQRILYEYFLKVFKSPVSDRFDSVILTHCLIMDAPETEVELKDYLVKFLLRPVVARTVLRSQLDILFEYFLTFFLYYVLGIVRLCNDARIAAPVAATLLETVLREDVPAEDGTEYPLREEVSESLSDHIDEHKLVEILKVALEKPDRYSILLSYAPAFELKKALFDTIMNIHIENEMLHLLKEIRPFVMRPDFRHFLDFKYKNWTIGDMLLGAIYFRYDMRRGYIDDSAFANIGLSPDRARVRLAELISKGVLPKASDYRLWRRNNRYPSFLEEESETDFVELADEDVLDDDELYAEDIIADGDSEDDQPTEPVFLLVVLTSSNLMDDIEVENDWDSASGEILKAAVR